jgi:putative transposase
LKLAKACVINTTGNVSLVLGHLAYATWKLWNVANYERKNWTQESGIAYPNWYDQKKRFKNQFWYNNLPSQSAQELLHTLDGAWKSFYKLKKTGGIVNPKPPKFKREPFNVRYLKDGFIVLAGNKIRLAVPKQLRGYLKDTFGFEDTFLYVDVPNHLQLKGEVVKTLEFKPLGQGKYQLIVVIEIPDIEQHAPSTKFMSLDFGINNFLSGVMYDGNSFVLSGRQLLSINRYFDKTIGYYDSLSDAQQVAKGVKYPKQSKRVTVLYETRQKQVHHLLHTMSRAAINMAIVHGVETIVIGDLTGIREAKDLGTKTNQMFHKWPFRKMAELLRYKAALVGIAVVSMTEEYTSQTCSVCKDMPSKDNARKANRKHRGLYICKDCRTVMNADINGARNIAKKYLVTFCEQSQDRPVVGLGRPWMYRFNGSQFVA